MVKSKLKDNETFLMYNLRYLVTNKYGSQKELANILEVSESSLTKYVNGTGEPPVHVLMKIKELHNIPIDKLLYQCADEKDEVIVAKEVVPVEQPLYDRFIGFYHVYYFNTNKNDMNSISLDKSLSYGLLLLYKKTNDLGLSSYYSMAMLGLTGDKLNYYSYLKHKEVEEIKDEFVKGSAKSEHVYCYKGVFDVMGSAVYIDFVNTSKDKANIILANPNSDKKYIGGLGTINSLSRGGEQNACVQFIGISKELIIGAETEIAQYLLINNAQFNLKEESKLLIEKFKYFNGSSDGYFAVDNLTTQEKEVLMQHNLELLVKKIYDNQRFKIGYVSNKQEKMWYKYIKEFNSKNRR